MTEKVYTPQDVAARYSVPLNTVYRWSSDGTLGGLRVGRHLRFRDSDLLAFERAAEKPRRRIA